MALLQIAEPGESAAPHQHRLAVGIDLGTTNSLVATVRSGLAVVLQRRTRPSAAALGGPLSADGTARSATRRRHSKRSTRATPSFGQALHGPRHCRHRQSRGACPTSSRTVPGMLRLHTVAGVKSPVEVSADILRTLRLRAEASLGGALVGAVITVPAYFDDAQRQATKDAARSPGCRCCACSTNRPRQRSPTASTTPPRVSMPSTTSAAALSTSRSSNSRGRLRGAGDRRRLGARRRRFRPSHLLLDLEAAKLKPLVGRGRAHAADEGARSQGIPDRARCGADQRALNSGERVDLTLTTGIFAEITQTLVAKTMQPVKKALRDAGLSVGRRQGRGDGRRRDAHAAGAARGRRVLPPGPAEQSRSRQGRRHRRGDAGQPAGRQPRRRRRLAAARRDSAVARVSRRWAAWSRRSFRATRRSRPRARRSSPPSATARRRWPSTSCRASASWSATAVRWHASSCAASRRWSPARRASASPSRSTPTVCWR
jgi:hypothetical protein